MQDASEATEILLEVVTYDPVRRLGFMRAVDPPLPGRVHFALSMLPPEFKRPIAERSKPIKTRARYTATRSRRCSVIFGASSSGFASEARPALAPIAVVASFQTP